MMRYLLYRMRYRTKISYAIILLSQTISQCDIVCDIPMMRYRMRCLMRYLSAVPCDIPCVNFLTCAIICFLVARPARRLGNFCCCLPRRRAPRKAGYVQTLYFTTGLHQSRHITHGGWAALGGNLNWVYHALNLRDREGRKVSES